MVPQESRNHLHRNYVIISSHSIISSSGRPSSAPRSCLPAPSVFIIRACTSRFTILQRYIDIPLSTLLFLLCLSRMFPGDVLLALLFLWIISPLLAALIHFWLSLYADCSSHPVFLPQNIGCIPGRCIFLSSGNSCSCCSACTCPSQYCSRNHRDNNLRHLPQIPAGIAIS